MSNAIESRLSALEQLVTKQNQKLHKGLSITIVVYIILVLFVLGYTLYIGGRLQEETSRANIANLVGMEVSNELPLQREQLINQLNANAQDQAIQAVDKLVTSMPDLETYLMQMMDEQTNQLIADLQGHVVPAFTEYLKEEAPNLEAQYAEMSDEEVMQGIVGLFVDTIDQEMDKYINESFVDEMNKLQQKIARLADPNLELTRQEDAQRRVIMTFAYLAETSETGESPLAAIFEELNDRYRFFSGEDLEQLNTPVLDSGDE